MKAVQIFFLTILLLAVKTYTQGVSEAEPAAPSTPPANNSTENPEILNATSPNNVSVTSPQPESSTSEPIPQSSSTSSSAQSSTESSISDNSTDEPLLGLIDAEMFEALIAKIREELEIDTPKPNPENEDPADEETDATSPPTVEATTEVLEPETTPTPYNCTAPGNFSKPENCSLYISCSGIAPNLISQEMKCPENESFSPILKHCSVDISPCGDGPVCLDAKTIPDPNNTKEYYLCEPSKLGWHKFLITCGVREEYSAVLERCTPVGPPLTFAEWLASKQSSSLATAKMTMKEIKKAIKMEEKAEKKRLKMEKKASELMQKYLLLSQPGGAD